MYDDKVTINLMKSNVSNLKKGTLRFWGEWFGRPMDNYHIITDVQFNEQEDILILVFNEGETLTICNPFNIECNSNEFYIRSALKIRWEWFSYGKKQSPQNLYYMEYEKLDSSIIVSSGKGEEKYIGEKVLKAVGQHAIEIC